jgi:hypothetical protein
VQICSSRDQETEGGRWWVQDQPGLHSKILSQTPLLPLKKMMNKMLCLREEFTSPSRHTNNYYTKSVSLKKSWIKHIITLWTFFILRYIHSNYEILYGDLIVNQTLCLILEIQGQMGHYSCSQGFQVNDGESGPCKKHGRFLGSLEEGSYPNFGRNQGGLPASGIIWSKPWRFTQIKTTDETEMRIQNCCSMWAKLKRWHKAGYSRTLKKISG